MTEQQGEDYWKPRAGQLVLGPNAAKGQVKRVTGLLMGIWETLARGAPGEPGYKKPGVQYQVLTHTGEEVMVRGNAAIVTRVSEADIGRFIRMEYKGEQPNAHGGQTKLIEVFVADKPNEKTPENLKMAWQDMQRGRLGPGGTKAKQLPPWTAHAEDDEPPLEEDDDLPF